MTYFSDRESGPRPRTFEEVTGATWGGVVALVQSAISTGAFGIDYPETCPDKQGPIGTDEHTLSLAARADIPDLQWPLSSFTPIPTLMALDLIEFAHKHISEPIQGSFHSYFGHHHLSFDRELGQGKFRDDVNQLFGRNALAYEIRQDGEIVRLAPPVLADAIASTILQTGDAELDRLLASASTRFLSPDLERRKESLEKLWDAWERLKTILHPEDKKQSVADLLDRVATEPTFRATLEAEAQALTRIGNDYRIRHSEVGKAPVETSAQIDYLFHRLFAMIRLLLSGL